MDKQITIYKAGTNEARLRVHIGVGSTAKFTLGKEDYVTLKFSSAVKVDFAYGDYIDINEIEEQPKGMSTELATPFNEKKEAYCYDNRLRQLLSNRYQLVDVSHPSYNSRTGGYDYTLRLDAWYMNFEHRLFMMPYFKTEEGRIVGDIVGRECDWSLTDKLEQHVLLLLYNLRSIGYSINAQIDFSIKSRSLSYTKLRWSDELNNYAIEHQEKFIDEAEEDKDEVFIEDDTKFVQYHNQKIISAINNIAKQWDCDWWVEGDVLHFGRLENYGVTDIQLGVQASAINSSNSSKGFATRLYVFGSTRNMPPTYRKELIFESSQEGADITDLKRPISPDWFSTRRVSGISGNLFDGSFHVIQDDLDNYTYTFEKSVPHKVSAISKINGYEYVLGYYNDVHTESRLLYGQQVSGKMLTLSFKSLYAITGLKSDGVFPNSYINEITIRIKQIVGEEEKIIGTYKTESHIYDYMKYGDRFYLRQFIIDPISISIENEGRIYIDFMCDMPSVVKYNFDYKLSNGYNTAYTTITFEDGIEEDVIINPDGLPSYNAESKKILSATSHPAGTKYRLSNLLWKHVPSYYYSGEFEDVAVLNKVADIRLRMPDCDYVDIPIGRGMEKDEIIEDVLILEDVYPHRDDVVSDIKTYTYQEKIVDSVTGEERSQDWNAYIIKGAAFSQDFSKDFILDGQDLMINFKSGKLAGMTFIVEYNKSHAFESSQPELLPNGTRNPEAQWFEIIKNEDYGIRLPNDVLCPAVGDKFVLFGYDTSYMGNTLVKDAEIELHKRAMLEAQKQIHNQATYDVTLLPYWLKESQKWFNVGDIMRIDTHNYFEPVREERIIGYEVKMDIPIDHPKFVVGESPAYSRLTSIESKIKS